jgi:HlyD family secretion protein
MNRISRLSLLGVFALAACSTGEATETPPIETVSTDTGNLRIVVEATGSIEPIRNVEVKSLASGEITRLYVDVGDEVQPGDLLAEVDPRDVRTAFRQAEADLGVAEARLEIARNQLQRSEDLYQAGVITEQEVENARLDYQNTEAQFIRSESSFELAELRLNDVTIRAPLAGTILTKSVEEGAVIQSASGNVSGGSVLFQMAALESMQVRTLIDETDIGRISAGMEATLSVEAFPDEAFRGEVLKIEPQAVVQSNVVSFPVIIGLDNREGLLKPGMNADVEILIDQAIGVMTIASSAIVQVTDVMAAAMALGLDTENMDLTAFSSTRGGARGGQRPGAGVEGAEGAGQAAGGQAAGGAPDLAAMRERIQSGEVSREEVAAMMQQARGRRGGGTGETVQGAGGAEIETSPAVVFVLNAEGIPEPRRITIGLADWDNTQVVDGLTGDEQVVIVGAAQLRAQQEAASERMRSRMGGSPFGR